MLYTFSYDSADNAMVIVKGSREDWMPNPITIKVNHVGIFQSESFLKLSHPVLANAFEVRNIDYSWSKGHIEKLRQ